MNKIELAKAIYQVSYLTGNFKLRSGKTSTIYFDKYLFESDPVLLAEIARQMSQKIPTDTEILAGLETGGIPLATALSLKTQLPIVFVRKQAKSYGTCKLAEGIDIKGKKLCIIEDVITTGGQVVSSAHELRKLGASLLSVVCVILRDDTARDNLKEIGLDIATLFQMEELNEKI